MHLTPGTAPLAETQMENFNHVQVTIIVIHSITMTIIVIRYSYKNLMIFTDQLLGNCGQSESM